MTAGIGSTSVGTGGARGASAPVASPHLGLPHPGSRPASNVVVLRSAPAPRPSVHPHKVPVERAAEIVVCRRVPRPQLSKREVEVLLAWLRTESKREAAQQLYITAATVSTHIARIRDKYAEVGRPAPTKAHLLIRALQDGYSHISDW